LRAWAVYFENGGMYWDLKSGFGSVRCIRRDPPSTAAAPRFLRTLPVADEPVVEDVRTGCFWQGCPAGLFGDSCLEGSIAGSTWQSALAYCEGLDWGGRTDWYLPNVIELRSVVDESRSSPAVDAAAFSWMPGYSFWSSTSYSGSSTSAWHVQFGYGYLGTSGKTGGGHVLCVRRGP
jgi:hypothetical protein